MSEPRTPRFSDRAVQVLLEQVRARREVFFPSQGRSVPREMVHQAWIEVAHSVNAKSEVPKTWLQCRKKFNGLTWTAKEKLAHKRRKRTSCEERPASILNLTQMEQEALDIIGPNSRRNLENGKAGGQVPQDLTHYLGFMRQEMEGGHFTEDAQSPAPSFQYITTDMNISSGMDAQLNGSAHYELFGSNEQELSIEERTVEETDDSRATSGPSYVEKDEDADLTGPAFKRKLFHEHHQLLKALDSLPKSCLTLSESVEESASIFCGVLAQGITTLQSTMERVANSMDAAMKPSVQEPVAPTLASLIEAQTGAIQALACTISTSLERLGGRIDRGFSNISDLLQSAVPQVNGSMVNESRPHLSEPAGVALAGPSLDNSTSAHPPSPPAPAAPAAAPLNLQSAIRPPRAQWDRRP
ncbi:uncharacterized protein LOC116967519 [Amblyraja radiata]|uniref:uncharacterized protein LOC116967519 n=1 Tax=Amblyraja radiata TaxID=386614 RepID=UPI0014034ECD|nr:uncharacterized protein LOC116967519 [Amblyraja radiata]